jgi:hypothetical protein
MVNNTDIVCCIAGCNHRTIVVVVVVRVVVICITYNFARDRIVAIPMIRVVAIPVITA